MPEQPNAPGSTGKFQWIRTQFTGKFWFRVSLFGVAAVVTLTLTHLAGFLVPETFADSIGANTARDVLAIIASSMLVVTTFSLGSLVNALAAAAQMATPRAARVLIDDAVSQNVISTFLGAFVFSMIGIFAISFGFYSARGEALLLIAAAIVVTLVILTLFGWLDYLANLVRLGETMSKIERRAKPVMVKNAAAPFMGAAKLTPQDIHGQKITATTTGYVSHIDIHKLEEVASEAGSRIAVYCRPGDMADPATALVRTGWSPDTHETAAIRDAFSIGPERSFDQDPRFCLRVLAEIAQRALSPGVNDPGTAIAVITYQQRLLTDWIEAAPRSIDPPEDCPHVAVYPLDPDELLQIALAPIARDGRSQIDVMLRLNHALNSLASLGDAATARAARNLRDSALDRAIASLDLQEDRERLEQEHKKTGTDLL